MRCARNPKGISNYIQLVSNMCTYTCIFVHIYQCMRYKCYTYIVIIYVYILNVYIYISIYIHIHRTNRAVLSRPQTQPIGHDFSHLAYRKPDKYVYTR